MDWDAVLLAVVAAIISIIVTFATGLRSVVTAWLKRMEVQVAIGHHASNLRDIAHFHEAMESLRDLEFIDSVLIFTCNNCGGVPKPGKPYYVQATMGWSTGLNKHPERLYAGPLSVDAEYMKMILILLNKTAIVLSRSEMNKESLLHKYYEREGVVQSTLHTLSIDAKELIFISIASLRAEFQEHELTLIASVVARVRGLMGTTWQVDPKYLIEHNNV